MLAFKFAVIQPNAFALYFSLLYHMTLLRNFLTFDGPIQPLCVSQPAITSWITRSMASLFQSCSISGSTIHCIEPLVEHTYYTKLGRSDWLLPHARHYEIHREIGVSHVPPPYITPISRGSIETWYCVGPATTGGTTKAPKEPFSTARDLGWRLQSIDSNAPWNKL